MAGRNFLFVPGPTNVPDRVQRAMVVAMEDHRSSKFPELTVAVLKGLKKVFKTEAGQVTIENAIGVVRFGVAAEEEQRFRPGHRRQPYRVPTVNLDTAAAETRRGGP